MWFLCGLLLGALAAWLAVYVWYEWQNIEALEAQLRFEHDAGVTMALYADAIDKLDRIRDIMEEDAVYDDC